MIEPNPEQRELIESTEGLYLVDAGAGTGKTFAVTRRYANIIEQSDVEPADVLLVTFTNNAATEMRDRIVAASTYGIQELTDAPIQTFHSLCNDILMEHGFEAPEILGIDDRITGSTRILDDRTVEGAHFREFLRRFDDAHPEHADVRRVVTDPDSLLDLVTRLAAKGVFPTRDGWYRNGADHLEGDFASFRACFDEVNAPRNDGKKQSILRSRLNRYGADRCYRSDAPAKTTIRGTGKSVPDETARLVFEEDRETLVAFVHDVYFEYLTFALSRNYLNFSFLQLFAFVLVCEKHALRESLSFEYVMIDEFQDSSEIQFKLALLLARTNNFCVVGDWKQSIYSFQYASIENILEFESRLTQFADELNEDAVRVPFPTRPITEIELVENYRSTQSILDIAEHGLVVPASNTDAVDEEAVRSRIVSLHSNAASDASRIEAFQHEDEHEVILTKIGEIVGNDAYRIDANGEHRRPTFGDVAVLTRTRDFGRELIRIAQAYEVPMAYEGGIELFRTDQAKLVLAWLRILDADADRGWAVVLEEAGYALSEIRHALETGARPADMRSFGAELATLEHTGAIVQRVCSQYGYDGEISDVLVETLQSVHSTTTMTRGDLIRFIERGIESGSTHEVARAAGTDSVTVQTIHATKGLEHPIVILANMNAHKFPSTGGSDGTITYRDPIGLRQRKVYGEDHGVPHVYDNWHTDVLRRCLPRAYDEERRLLYVAMTRAKHHLLFSAGEKPNAFLEALPVPIDECQPDVERPDAPETAQTELQIAVPTLDGPTGYSPHALMRDDVFEGAVAGRGMAYGSRVHEFAERYATADGSTRAPASVDERNVKAFVDSLEGAVRVEEDVYLPLTVDGEQITIHGIVDLVHIRDDRVTVVDFKTDRDRRAQEEYRIQLSIYHHVLADWFPNREIESSILYTGDGERVEIEPYSRAELGALVREQVSR